MTTLDVAPIELAKRLDALHQLLYVRGGIRPSNAAVEELTKLLLLRLAVLREPNAEVTGLGRLADIITPEHLAREDGVLVAKAAFTAANSLPALRSMLPDGESQPVWPEDEPLRIGRTDVLAEAANILWELELEGSDTQDIAGTAFDVFLRGRYEHAGGLGTYLTPEGVVDLMVSIGFELLEQRSPEYIVEGLMGDPCCGSGRFLIGLLHEAKRRDHSGRWLESGSSLFGADQSASSVAMARVNLMAAGVRTPGVFLVEDSITDNWVSSVRGRFSLILTNPPFGDKKYDSTEGIAQTVRVLPSLAGLKRIDPALAFVGRCVDLLAPSGVAGIILPDGVGNGISMRDLLLGNPRLDLQVSIEGVVSLPATTFAPAGTTAKTSVTFIRKSPRNPERYVFLARADHIGYVMSKGAKTLDPKGNDLPAIAEDITRLIRTQAPPRDPSERVLGRRSADLTSLDASTIDSSAERARCLLKDRGGLEARTVLRYGAKRRHALVEQLPFVSVLHVDELGIVDWGLAISNQPTTPGQLAEPGDLMVSLLNPRKFRAAVVPEDPGLVQCSAEFGVFQTDIDAYAALTLLQHPLVRQQIAPLGRGTSSSRRRIIPDDVLSLILPPFDDDWAVVVGGSVRNRIEFVAESKEFLRSLYSEPMGNRPR